MAVDPYRNAHGVMVADAALFQGADLQVALELRREVDQRVGPGGQQVQIRPPDITAEVTVEDLSLTGRATMDLSVSKVQQRYWFTWVFNRAECEALLRKLNKIRHHLDEHITFLQRENNLIACLASSKIREKENQLVAVRAERDARQREKDDFQRQLGEMTQHRDRFQREKGDVQRDLDGMTADRDRKLQEKNRFQEERGALEIERNRLTERIGVLDARIPELERQFQRAQEEAAAAQRAMIRIQEELAESQRSGRVLTERVSKLSEDCTQRAQENEQLAQFARECDGKNKALMREMRDLRAQQEIQLREMESGKNAQLSEARVRILAAEREAEELKQANAQFGSRVEILAPVAARVPDLEREKERLSQQVLILTQQNKTKDEQFSTQMKVIVIVCAIFAAVLYVMNSRARSPHAL